jgi:hypothetical protein
MDETSMIDINFSKGTIYPNSVVRQGGTTYFLTKLHANGERRLGISGDIADFRERVEAGMETIHCPLTPANAAALRARLPWLNPVPLGRRSSFGFGDRLGSATPGHIQALRTADPMGKIAPVFAQQSVRENTRIGRTPQQVMDDAIWGLFQEGWRAPWGADADHVKEMADLGAFIAAGYTCFTIDPSDQVDNSAQNDAPDVLRRKMEALPWDTLQSSYNDMRRRYCQTPFTLDGLTLEFDEMILSRALAKYGRALSHTILMTGELTAQMGGNPYDLEMSVDETDTPTSAHEHFFIANELTRCRVPITGLAPRFVGKFQKGVDYIGNIDEFERELARHAAILHSIGSYKLSIHTGSDKFSIYPVISQYTNGLAHIKTAGTSYLEALRVAARAHPALFRSALDLARSRFVEDRQTYFLDCRPEKVPSNGQLRDADLPGLLEDFDARQLLHVTFGSVLDVYGHTLKTLLAQHESEYQAALKDHFCRHILPFI